MNERTDRSTDNAQVELLIDEYLALIQKGAAPSVREFAELHSEYASELLEFLPVVAKLDGLSFNTSVGDVSAGLPTEYQLPEKIGEYEIVRELGRGGMGVVYEARHKTMERLAALKVIPWISSQPAALDRFLREARSGGSLHHTNIVPVFEVGHADGYYFFAMQLIDGQNLREVIDEIKRIELVTEAQPTSTSNRNQVRSRDLSATHSFYWGDKDAKNANRGDAGVGTENSLNSPIEADKVTKEQVSNATVSSNLSETHRLAGVGPQRESYYHRVARVGQQVAEALDHAHSNGIVHRDIKPSNLILDTDGCVWVTDFGLAKTDSDDLTATGDVIGTLRYMAPERLKGIADACGDIYSLGLTLYELCTFRQAFDGVERFDVLRQLERSEPVKPRKVRPSIPPDFETIILKAIHRQPEKRYATAQLFAEDLRRFIEHRPIQARRVSAAERTWRWCKRNKMLASLGAALAATLMIIVAGSIQFGLKNAAHVTELNAEVERTDKMHRLAVESLFQSHADRARLLQQSTNPGRNFESLATIKKAVDLLPDLHVSNEVAESMKFALRNQAVASMAMLDVRQRVSWMVEDPATPATETEVVAYDYVGNRFAQADKAGNIHIRSLRNHTLLATLPAAEARVHSMSISDDGRYLLSRHFDTQDLQKISQYVWDLDSFEKKFELVDSTALAQPCLVDGETLLVTHDVSNQFKFYDLRTGEVVRTVPTSASIGRAVFASDGETCFSSSESSLDVISIPEEGVAKTIQSLQLPSPIVAVDYCKESQLLSIGCYDRNVYIYSLASVFSPELSPDTTASDKPLVPIHVLTGHKSEIRRIKLNPQATVAMVTAFDGITRIYRLHDDKQVVKIDGLQLSSSDFDKSGTRIGFSSRFDKLGIWELPPDLPMKRTRIESGIGIDSGLRSNVSHPVQMHPHENDIVVVGNENGLEFWSIETGQMLFRRNGQPVASLRFSRKGELLVSGPNGLQKFDLEVNTVAGETRIELSKPETLVDRPVCWFHLHSEKPLIAFIEGEKTDSGFAAVVLNTETGNETKLATNGWSVSVHLDRTGMNAFVTSSHASGVTVYNAKTGKAVECVADDWKSPAMAFSPAGNRFVIDSLHRRGTYDSTTRKLIFDTTRERPRNRTGSLDFSSDGKILASLYSRYVPQLIDFESGTSLVRLAAPTDNASPQGLQFSGDQRWLIYHDANEIYSWDLTSVRRKLDSLGLNW